MYICIYVYMYICIYIYIYIYVHKLWYTLILRLAKAFTVTISCSAGTWYLWQHPWTSIYILFCCAVLNIAQCDRILQCKSSDRWGFLKWGIPKPWVSILKCSNFGWFGRFSILGNLQMATALSASQMDTAPGHPTNQVCMDKPSWHQPAAAKHPIIPRLSCQLKDGFKSVMPGDWTWCFKSPLR